MYNQEEFVRLGQVQSCIQLGIQRLSWVGALTWVAQMLIANNHALMRTDGATKLFGA